MIEKEIIIREAINETVESARLDILRSFESSEEWVTVAEVTSRNTVSRQTVSKHLEEFVATGLVNYDANVREYSLTTGGAYVIDRFETCLETIPQEHLAELTRSKHAINLLRELDANPSTSDNLVSKSCMPSKATIFRLIDNLSDCELAEERSGVHYLDDFGSIVLAAYEEFERSVAICIEKAPILQRLDPDLLTGDNPLPVDALADSELVFSGSDTPGLVVSEAIKLADPRTKQYNCIISIYNPALFQLYYKLVGFGMESEGIIDASVYEKVCDNPDLSDILDNSKYDHYNLYRLEDSHTLGIALYDERKIAIGAYNSRGRGQHIAVITSNNEELIKWGKSTFRSYREDAIPTKPPD